MAIIGYVRVSDDDQNEDLQVDALKAAGCKYIFGDHGVSGVTIRRKGLDDVMATLQTGDTLLVWRYDRLGRSPLQLLMIDEDLRQRGIRFISMTQGIDTYTAEGRVFYGVLAHIAEYERENICKRTKAGMAAAKQRGKHVGRPRKLSNYKIRKIKRIKRKEQLSHPVLAKRFGISTRTLSRALNRTNAYQ